MPFDRSLKRRKDAHEQNAIKDVMQCSARRMKQQTLSPYNKTLTTSQLPCKNKSRSNQIPAKKGIKKENRQKKPWAISKLTAARSTKIRQPQSQTHR
jgi:hypothetical protein